MIGHENPVKAPNGVSLCDDLQAVKEVRKLVIDCCRQNGGGHGGSAVGMAPLAVALWKHTMRYNPSNPDWFDRDRFVLSNGHAAILLYVMLHLSGYKDITMDELKMYGNPKAVDKTTGKWKSTLCHGHPEITVPGVEVTTGPLGQGIANAVGLAIASKHHAANFNTDGNEIIASRVYCTTGDGCIQEGVALEAMAIAGRLGLNNLILCYDNNQVTCDGPLDWILVEDTNAKVRAMGWNVIDVYSGDTSVDEIRAALTAAQKEKTKPTFINIRTTIGFGTSVAGTFKAHHGTYSDEDAAAHLAPGVSSTHEISHQARNYFKSTVENGARLEDEWNLKVKAYCKSHPEKAKLFKDCIDGKLDYQDTLLSMAIPSDIQATRQWNGTVFNKLMSEIPSMMAGGADLWNSNQMGDQSSRIFDRLHPEGRVIRYGIREHAMASISNGLAAYSPGGILPVTATFFMFYLYAAAGVRMGALSELQVIHVATHDSIGEGQNGPTHQPVELDSLYRAMPSLLYIRPADAEEVLGAWLTALGSRHQPSIISLARDPAITGIPNTNRLEVQRGGYVVAEKENAVVTLVSCGSELQFAYLAAVELNAAGIATRVVSMPCIRLFEQQPQEYQDTVLSSSPHIISVEAYISTIWARFCTGSVAMDSFGYSGAGIENFARFGLDPDGIVRKVKRHVQEALRGKGGRKWTLLT
ncbi:Transketolase, thiamine diphosphate binding domain-containing protein [Xylogone sp. PMI_703]|nr:Transketolase, thiamine diphosphate binding domain-containing protein [Xylogone sp. PMI_703]